MLHTHMIFELLGVSEVPRTVLAREVVDICVDGQVLFEIFCAAESFRAVFAAMLIDAGMNVDVSLQTL